MKFLVLKIDTGSRGFEKKLQLDLVQELLYVSSEFSIDGTDKYIAEFLMKESTDICNNSNANLAIEVDNDNFKIYIDINHLEFFYEGISLEIVDYNLLKNEVV